MARQVEHKGAAGRCEPREAVVESKPDPPRLLVLDDGETCRVELEENGDLNPVLGTTSSNFADQVVTELIHVASTSPIEETPVNAALAAVNGIGPRGELEAMLASQMFAAHRLAMKAAADAAHIKNLALQDMKAKQAAKLMRVFTSQMEALQRYRGKGQQKMTVEHVHVHEGGQAVVGQVASEGSKGGWAGRPTEPGGTTP